MGKDLLKRLTEQDEDELEDIDTPEDLPAALEVLSNKIQAAIEVAQDIARATRKMGGEIDRVVGGQLESYTIGTLKSFIENENQPGAIASLQHFLEKEA